MAEQGVFSKEKRVKYERYALFGGIAVGLLGWVATLPVLSRVGAVAGILGGGALVAERFTGKKS